MARKRRNKRQKRDVKEEAKTIRRKQDGKVKKKDDEEEDMEVEVKKTPAQAVEEALGDEEGGEQEALDGGDEEEDDHDDDHDDEEKEDVEQGGEEEDDDDDDGDDDDDDDDDEEEEEEDNEDENDKVEDENTRTTDMTGVATAIKEPTPKFASDGRYRNKQRCLLLCSRGVTARYRHLLEDLRVLIPHHKKDSKLDPGDEGAGRAVNAIAEMRSCNTVLFLECRKRQDAYLWMGRVGETAGPSVRFHVSNIHTMDELRLTGNCMKGSRPILSFDSSFDKFTHLKLIKVLFIDVFGTPRGHPKSKPFVDRVMGFYYADKKIWVRNYQIVEKQASNAMEAHQSKKESGQSVATSLVEIGPRFVLNPIRIFRGSFGGQTLYKNEDYVSPNEIRSLEKKGKGNKYAERKKSQKKRKARQEALVLPEDPLDSVFR